MKICKHQMWLINQGIHWCELQLPNYPKCEGCEHFEELEIGETVATSTKSIIEIKKNT